MRYITLAVAFVAVPAFADEKAKPNTLTSKEMTEGWILLFDGETTFGWAADGEVKAKDGALVVGGVRAGAVRCTTALKPVDIEFEISADGTTWRSGSTGGGDTIVGIIGGKADPVYSVSKPLFNEASGQLSLEVPAGKPVHLRSVKARPVKTSSLFNGKDLARWKVYDPAKAKAVDPKARGDATKSKFTVTREGWLNVKDGPGDLQTEGQWADFVLQLECISNGKHLNSGLFFRCIPDLYQQGYEAQIRNQWEADDRMKPVDFGTGAIYRRQAARKVVSTDGEWFTLTVAAHGRHIATWVNGYQVTDWTDDRKESDNARQGFKKGKGTISIQGHDPTTDLSFRNIRIQSLDSK